MFLYIGSLLDYAPVVDQVLEFQSCQREACIEIDILSSSEIESTEQFRVSVRRPDTLHKKIKFLKRKQIIRIFDGESVSYYV